MYQHLLTSEKRNIYVFYILSAVMNFWFIASNWIYFWTKYMTYGQLGWVDAAGFGFALLLEVPSGAVADLLGKKRTIQLGFLAGTIGIAIVTFSGSLTGIFVGWVITQVCYAFYSGAAEALTYDTLADLKEESSFANVITRGSAIENYTTAIATFLGGLLYTVDFRLPHILWGSGMLLGLVFSSLLIEPKHDTEKFSLKVYLSQLTAGVKELARPELRNYMGFFLILVGGYFMYSWGILRPATATSFGFFAREQGVILPLLTIFGAIIVRGIPLLKKKFSDVTGFLILSTLMAGGFILAAFPIGYWGIVTMIVITIAGKLATPWISIIVNARIESKYRATTLSTVALLTKLPYVLVAITAGQMIEKN
nr:MFS transporter [Patescibacteria group bacterium]